LSSSGEWYDLPVSLGKNNLPGKELYGGGFLPSLLKRGRKEVGWQPLKKGACESSALGSIERLESRNVGD